MQQPASAPSPDAAARTQDLLYVSHHDDGSVDIYSYPDGIYRDQLKDVRASGLCSDNSGDVFIPSGNSVLQYAHGESRPIAVLRGSLGGSVQSCAVDATTGNLAVSGGSGPRLGVAVYAHAQGTPKVYGLRSPSGAYLSSAYDDQGNLFVESATRGVANVVVLPKDAERLANIVWSGTRPTGVGSVQWDGKYLAFVGSALGSATIFRYSVQGTQATFADQAALKGSGSGMQSWIQGGSILVPGSDGVRIYAYPGGGVPTAVIKDARGLDAATVSSALKLGLDVTTYHYDNYRTGWDNAESSLKYKNVGGGKFGLQQSVTLDDQVDAQPLVVRNQGTKNGKSKSKDDTVYVATENNTVYAIDATTGAVLNSKNLGTPVQTPLGCNNNGPNVGIDSTPVIDLSANAMYVIAYTLVASVPTYEIHELDLSNLSDIVPPVVIAATHKLSDGSTYSFNATYERQRPALLESNGNIYAGFGSFCDFGASISRGWLLGWQAGSLTPLAANRLNDSLAGPNFLLSAIWMSGYGMSADPSGNIYFVTGNSQSGTYDGQNDVQESVVKVSSDLTQLLSIFTPSDVNQLDNDDTDFGSGGVLLLPSQDTSATPLAAAAGKAGTMFVMNQNSLGGFSKNYNNVLAQQSVGGCWCGFSYFASGANAQPRIVSSGGNNVTIWKVKDGKSVKLSGAGSSSGLPNGQDPGFFTAVSSNGNHAGAIIWAVSRPSNVPGSLDLFAFKSEGQSGQLQTLYQGTAGYWDSTGGNANIAPVVANGKVYVASYKQLDIFGVGGNKGVPKPPAGLGSHRAVPAPNQLSGMLVEVGKSFLTMQSRTGSFVKVDFTVASRRERTVDLVAGHPFTVRGKYDSGGVLHAYAILRAKPSEATWPSDKR
jgi:PQQ enzyme repeat